MPGWVDLGTFRERVRGSLAVEPALGLVAGAAVGAALARLPDGPLTGAFPGDADSARQLLGTVAATVMTVTSLAFTITVVALQLTSSQFSPRLLRAFSRDRVVKGTLTVLVTTFAYCLAVLRDVTGRDGVPQPAMLGALFLSALSVGLLVRFIARIVTAFRVDTLMTEATVDTHRLIRTLYADADAHPDGDHHGDAGAHPDGDRHADAAVDREAAGAADAADAESGEPPARDVVLLRAPRSGFVQAVDLAPMLRLATRLDAVAWVDVTAGDHVVRGVPVGRLSAAGHQPVEPPDPHRLARVVADTLAVGNERTPQQDVAFGFRQLADISLKSMSPAVNDPTTAVHAVGHLAGLLAALARRRLDPVVVRDGSGATRVVAHRLGFGFYVDLACSQLRRVAAGEPAVLEALLQLLRDVASVARTDDQRTVLATHVDLVEAAGERGLPEPRDRARLRAAAERARAALRGDWVLAYRPQ